MNREDLKLVIEMLESEKPSDAQLLFDKIPKQQNVEYFLVKGKLEQKFQRWGEAINAFLKVIEMEPNNSEAQNNLQIIHNILNFWSPEMFNP